ncbi:hypothetical protein ABI59_23205 [Acidobacteria bacterium Mor1]|nr:hypothetical protein ABI59_23205 [Acidobacteria bacterium Mor1]
MIGLLGLKPGQGKRTFLVAAYLYLVIAAYLMLKSASKSLFLEAFGAKKLPLATIFIAIFVGLFAAAYIRISRRLDPTRLVVATLLFLAANLMGFWWLDHLQVSWVYPVFFVWVGMFGVIAPTQVWTLANDLFTTREAKRVFGVIGAGGIIGAISGGAITGTLATRIGTANLLPTGAILLLLATGIVVLLSRHQLQAHARRDEMPPPRRLSDSLRLVARSPHLRLVAALVMITAVATKMVDWQFNAVAEEAFQDADARTAFFGAFDAITGFVGFLIQAFLTSRLLMYIGLGGAILLFPLLMTFGTAALIPVVPIGFALKAATLAKGADQTLKHSIDRSSRELLYLPVSRTIKVQAKSAIDMVIDRSGDGIAGLVQLAVITLVTLPTAGNLTNVRHMALVNLVFLALWILVAVRLRRSYISELERSVVEGNIEIGSWHEAVAGAEALDAVRTALRSSVESEVIAALDLVGRNPQWDLSDALDTLIRDGSPEIRARALAIRLAPENPDLPEGVTRAFAKEDQALLAECIDLQLASDPAERRKRAEAILNRAGGPARGAWIALMVRRLGPEFQPMARTLIEELLHPDSPSEAREVATTAIGLLPDGGGMGDLLPPLLEDSQRTVSAAAVRACAAIGGEESLRALVPLLAQPLARREVRQALRSQGDAAVPMLAQAAGDTSLPHNVRRRIPSVLSAIGSGAAVEALSGMLRADDPRLVQAAGEALYRVRLVRPERSLLPARDARAMIREQGEICGRLWRLLQALERTAPEPCPDARALLIDSVREAYRQQHTVVFRTLCLAYSPRHILSCRRSLLDRNLELRANAAELLDNLMPHRLWRELVPILYPEEHEGKRGSKTDSEPLRGVLAERLGDEFGPWILTAALYYSVRARLQGEQAMCRRLADHPHDWIRETARAGLDHGFDRNRTRGNMTVVEKVVALRKVEIFRESPPEQLALIAAISREETVEDGFCLAREGDPPGDLFVLLDGRVRIRRGGNHVGDLGPGDAIGTWTLFDDEPLQVGAETSGETALLRIDRFALDEVLEEHPEISRTLIQQLIQRLRRMADSA